MEQLIGTVVRTKLHASKLTTKNGIVHFPRSIVKKVVSQKIKPKTPTLPINIVHQLTTTALDESEESITTYDNKMPPISFPKPKKRRSRRKAVKSRADKITKRSIDVSQNKAHQKSLHIEQLNKDEVVKLR